MATDLTPSLELQATISPAEKIKQEIISKLGDNKSFVDNLNTGKENNFYQYFDLFEDEDQKKLAKYNFENTGNIDIPINNKWIRIQITADKVTGQDITEIMNSSVFDEQTGLYGKNSYIKQITQITQELSTNNEGRKKPVAYGLILLDLNWLKQFNDNIGHHAGDALLIATGSLLKSISRGSDLAFRYGGDEFAIILPDMFDNPEEKINPQIIINNVVNRIENNNKTVAQLLQLHCQNQVNNVKDSSEKQSAYEKIYKEITQGINNKILEYIPQLGVGYGILNRETTKNGIETNLTIKEIDDKMYANKKVKKEKTGPLFENNFNAN